MKTAVIVDLHLTGENYIERCRHLANALTIAKAEGVTLVLFGGDWSDRAQVLDRAKFGQTIRKHFLDTIVQADIPWLIIPGNHDISDKASEETATSLLYRDPLCTVVERAKVVTYPGLAVACLPWPSRTRWMLKHTELTFEERDAKWRDLCRGVLAALQQKLAGFQGYKILLGHCEVSGATNSFQRVLEGGTFPFSGSDLASVGADLVALGHYHKRQGIPGCPNGYYVGALVQKDFGEQENPCGFLIVDTATRDLTWVDLPDAPRHYTVPVADYRAADYRPMDKIKLRGTEAPAELPANVIFERAVTVREAMVRVAGVDPSSPVTHLLAEWAMANALTVDVEQLVPLVTELGAGEQAQTWKRGSLDRIIEIHVRGFGPHRDTHITLEHGDWWAICGANGQGKTLLIEAPVACWYGCWAHPHRGSLYDLMTQEQGTLEVTWESAGVRYRMTRRLRNGKTQKHEAHLVRFDGSKVIEMAGPKVADAQSAVEQILGPKSLLLGGPWLTQKAEGDLVSEDPAGRKNYMRKYLILDQYDPWAERAKTQASEMDGRLRGQEQLIAGLPALQERSESLVQTLAGLRGEDETLAQTEQETASRITSLREQHIALVAARDTRAGKENAVQAAWQEQARSGRALVELGTRRRKLEEALAGEPALQADLAKLEEAKLALEDGRQAHQARAKRQAERAELQTAQERLRGRIRDARRSMENQADGTRAGIKSLKEDLARAQASEHRLQNVGCAANLLPCRLIDGARAEQAKLPDIQARIAEGEAALDQLEYALNVEQDYAQAEQAELAELELKLLALTDASGEVPDLRPLQARVTELEQVERKIGALEQARQQLSQLDQDAFSATEQVEAATLRLKRAEEDLAACPVFDQPSLDALNADIRATEDALKRTNNERRDKAGDIGGTNRDIQTVAAELARVGALEESLKQDRSRRDGFRLLERAFGRDGIPQLLISAAIPAIQDILNEVCEVDFRGRFSLRLDTLRATKTAGSKESFDILFSTGGQEYDARGCSGGEEAAVRAALRTALVLYQAGQAADSYRVAVLDEPAAHQDAENAAATFALLARLKERFRQVLVVSHDEDMLAAFSHRVTLEKGPRGTQVAGQAATITEEALAA